MLPRRVLPAALVLLACTQSAIAADPAPPASRPAAAPLVDQTFNRMVERANLVLTEPLGAGATVAQAKVVMTERADRVQRLADPLIGQPVLVVTPIADVIETASDRSLPQTSKLAAKGQFVVDQAPQVEADWRKRLADIAADYDKRIRAKNPLGLPGATDADKQKKLREERTAQQMNLPRATVIVTGDDELLARRGGGAAMRVEGVVRKVEFVPWLPVSAGMSYPEWSKGGRLVITVVIPKQAK